MPTIWTAAAQSQLEMENKASCGQIRMEPPMRERVD